MGKRGQPAATLILAEEPTDLKEEAYELWLTVGGRSSRTVARMLEARGTPVPDRTVRYWQLHDDWDNRAYRDLRRLIPHTTIHLLSDIMAGLQESVALHRSIVNDPDIPIDTRQSAARELRDVALPLLERFAIPDDTGNQVTTATLHAGDPAAAIAALRASSSSE